MSSSIFYCKLVKNIVTIDKVLQTRNRNMIYKKNEYIKMYYGLQNVGYNNNYSG